MDRSSSLKASGNCLPPPSLGAEPRSRRPGVLDSRRAAPPDPRPWNSRQRTARAGHRVRLRRRIRARRGAELPLRRREDRHHMSETSRPTRPALSRRFILETALHIVDRDGPDGLTMRRLGTELGVDPMAVYHYVPSKTALFDGITEAIWASLDVRDINPDDSWQQQLAHRRRDPGARLPRSDRGIPSEPRRRAQQRLDLPSRQPVHPGAHCDSRGMARCGWR